MQEPEIQPSPTRSPTLSFLAALPTWLMVPTTSWPGTNGYCDMPHSFFHIDRSEWQMPAIFDVDFDFFGAEFGQFKLERFEFGARGTGGESFNFLT